MVVAGVALFGAAQAVRQALPEPKPEIVVPGHQYEMAVDDFFAAFGRSPTDQERAMILDRLIDDAVLYTYALELGLHESPASRRRLAQIAGFVRSNAHEPAASPTEASLAEEAVTLGLHRGDLVVRRIMIDSARRLIRSVALLREPKPEYVSAFYRSNAEEFTTPLRVRITHVMVNAFKWGEQSEARAEAMLATIRQARMSTEAAVALGDGEFEPAMLPALDQRALSARFGVEFADAVTTLPERTWMGPIPSRFGYHLVFVEAREEPELPGEAEISSELRRRALQKIADDWLALRLAELRSAYTVVLPVVSS